MTRKLQGNWSLDANQDLRQNIDVNHALEQAKQGRFTPELKKLYNMPYRNTVDWTQFPTWARPDYETEGCHEG